MDHELHDTAFRVAMVPGIMPGKWVRAWQERFPAVPLELVAVDERDQLRVVRDREAHMAFVRDVHRPDDLHLVPLYEELSVVVLSRDHLWAEADELTVADLTDEVLLQDPGTVPGWPDDDARTWATELSELTLRQAVETVAAGTGIVVVPMSVARLHHRKDVVAVPVADLPAHPVGLAWPRGAEQEDGRIDDFVGVVRGRTVRSSRGAAPAEPAPDRRPKPARGAARPTKGGRGRSARGRRGRRG